MSLTKQDLNAIGKLIEASENRLETRLEARLVARIDDLDDVLSLQMERSFQEIRDEVRGVKSVVDRINRVQRAEVIRNDHQDLAIKKIRKALHAA